MAEHGINKSRHLLKRLEEEMVFLSSIMTQIESLSTQAQFVSSGIKMTWSNINKIYKEFIQDIENK
jgi:hypothetical protein